MGTDRRGFLAALVGIVAVPSVRTASMVGVEGFIQSNTWDVSGPQLSETAFEEFLREALTYKPLPTVRVSHYFLEHASPEMTEILLSSTPTPAECRRWLRRFQ